MMPGHRHGWFLADLFMVGGQNDLSAADFTVKIAYTCFRSQLAVILMM